LSVIVSSSAAGSKTQQARTCFCTAEEFMDRLFNIIFAALLGSMLATPALAMDPSCQPAADASAKMLTTPTHITSTTTAAYTGGKPRNTESIYAGNAIYVNVGGKWSRSKMTPQEMLKMEQENRGSKKGTCHYVRDELVNGEAAALYAEQSDTEVGKSEAQTWISKSRGLPLRTEMDIDVGGSMGKSHMSMHYDYTNVQPPAGVQ
jgi:hypothetical protein